MPKGGDMARFQNRWEVRCELPFDVQGGNPSLTPRNSLPGAAGGILLPELRADGFLPWTIHTIYTLEIFQNQVGSSHLSKYPSSEWDQPLLICRNTRKPPIHKTKTSNPKVLVVFEATRAQENRIIE